MMILSASFHDTLLLIVLLWTLVPHVLGATTTAAASRATSTAVTPAPTAKTSAASTSTPKTSTPPTSTAKTSTTAGVASSASFTFRSMSTMTACATQSIIWDTTGFDPKSYSMDLSILNIGINQSIPTGNVQPTTPGPATPSTASIRARGEPHWHQPLVARASPVNQTVGTISAQSPYNILVSVPRGRFYLHGVINNPAGTWANSMVFTVVEGRDNSCLHPANASSSSAATSTNTEAAASATSAAATNSTSAGSSIKGGAIAGIVVGVVASLSLVGLLFFCLRRRKMRAQTAQDYAQGPATTGIAHSTSRQSVRHARRAQSGHIALASFGGGSDDHEKDPYAAVYQQDPNTPPSSNPFTGGSSAPLSTEHDAYGGISQGPDNSVSSGAATDASNDDFNPGPATCNGGSLGGASVGRSTSTRRKPVPSLGLELRNQLERQQQDASTEPGPPHPMRTRQNFRLMPDPPAQ